MVLNALDAHLTCTNAMPRIRRPRSFGGASAPSVPTDWLANVTLFQRHYSR